jgi:hypothetical protein
MTTRGFSRLLITVIAALICVPAGAAAGVVLKLGDILVAEPGTASISVVDPATGGKTIISQGGLLSPEDKTVAVALASDGDIITVHRMNGLIRVNPATGTQSVLSQGGHFRDPWAIAIDRVTGYIYVADSGYDNDRPEINEAGKIVRVDPLSGAQELIAWGSPCNFYPTNAACQNTTSAGSYLAHPYGIAIDYTTSPVTLVVADMGSFNGKGAIVRIEPLAGGAQTLLWGPASASPPPRVEQSSPLACPMGIAVEPTGNILTTAFTYPVPPIPTVPPPDGTYYGCAPPGIFRVDLINNVQTIVNANAPPWRPNHAYAVGNVIRDDALNYVHRVVTAGISQSPVPDWSETLAGTTADGSVVWQNIGRGDNWLIPFGLIAEPAPTASDPSRYNIIVGDEGHSMVIRLDPNGVLLSAPVAANISNVTSVDVITFTPPGGFKVEPAPSDGQPTETLPAGTTQATLSLVTDVDATCRYSLVAGVAFESMPNTFTTTGTTTHETTVTGLSDGGSYNFYIRCMDSAGNVNTSDFTINISVARAPSIDPIAAYGFDEGTGSALTDGSGNVNTGIVSGAIWTAQGKFGRALDFDGVNDWVTIADSATLDLTTGMTVEAWVYPTANAGDSWTTVLIKERAGGEVFSLYASADTNTPSVYVVSAGQPNTPLDARGTSPLPLNAWTHLAATYDGTTLRLYTAGIEVASRAVGGPLLTSTGALRIGGNAVWGEFFQGRIDEVRVYDRALTQAEIVADMNAPVNDPSSADTTAPFRSDGQPIGTLESGTTQTTLSLTTDEDATCRYAPQAGVTFGSMTTTFMTTGSMTHATVVSGLTSGGTYQFYVRCADAAANANTDDFVVAFSVAGSSATTSNFAGAEGPLVEGGMWDSPGAWADLHKNDGAYAVGLNAQGRLVTPAMGAAQYSEITYDRDPGSSSWVGVATRVQSGGNGSGYLAIAYAGEVRLYRTDDSGSLNFTMLASASADLGSAPRRLRLESEGNTHRVYLNGTQMISHSATGTVYSSGQPGIAASVFGGPQVKILSFEGGNLGTE